MTAAGSDEEQDQRDMLRLATGHEAALNDLMERHGGRLLGYLMRCLQNEDDAADMAQETFVRVFQNRAKFDPQKKFSSWLYAIATNLVKDRYRWRARHRQVSLDAEQQETGVPFGKHLQDDCPNPGERLQSSERAEAVRKAIAALPEELSTPLILAEYEDRSQAEIGEIMGCTAKAVETRIYRARKQLREMLGALIQQ